MSITSRCFGLRLGSAGTASLVAPVIAVYLLCVLRARYDLLLDTEGLCDESSVCYAENKCTAQV